MRVAVRCAGTREAGGAAGVGDRRRVVMLEAVQRATEFDEPLMDQRMCHEFALSARTLEVRDEVLRGRARNNLNEFPPVLAEVVEDRLCVVNEQRRGEVFPSRHT